MSSKSVYHRILLALKCVQLVGDFSAFSVLKVKRLCMICKIVNYTFTRKINLTLLKQSKLPLLFCIWKKVECPLTVKKIILYCDNNWLLYVKKISCEQKNKWLGLHWQNKVQKIKSISIFMHTIYCTSIHNVP